MEIKITLETGEFSNEDKELIKDCLNITDADFDQQVSKLCKTAFFEYFNMFKEKGIPKRAEDIIQERLFNLLKYYFIDKLPSEREISSIFQLTSSQSKTLINNTKSRYRTKIKTFIANSLKNIVSSATKVGGIYEIIIQSPNLFDELNQIIMDKKPSYDKVTKKRGTACKYICDEDSYNLLKDELGL